MVKDITLEEATVISTTFSVVSITFAIVIAETIRMQDQFSILFNSCHFM